MAEIWTSLHSVKIPDGKVLIPTAKMSLMIECTTLNHLCRAALSQASGPKIIFASVQPAQINLKNIYDSNYSACSVTPVVNKIGQWLLALYTFQNNVFNILCNHVSSLYICNTGRLGNCFAITVILYQASHKLKMEINDVELDLVSSSIRHLSQPFWGQCVSQSSMKCAKVCF